MRNQLLAVICLMLLSQIVLSQECSMTPPDGLDCSTAIHLCGKELNGFESILPADNTGNNPNDQLCFNSDNDGGMVNNINWFSFIACSSYVELSITPDNCTVSNALVGLQAGIYAECDFQENLICIVDCFDSQTTLSAIGFVPNQRYFLFVDGCNGSICEYRIDVVAGIDIDDIFLETPNNQQAEIIGESNPCLSSVVNYTYSVPECMVIGDCIDYNPYELGLACYEWTIPPGSSIIGDPNGPEIEIEFGQTGNFILSVELFLDPSIESCAGGQGQCGPIPALLLDIRLPDYTFLDPIYFCPGDSVHFCGKYYNTPQDVICENPLDACSAQVQPILIKQEITEDLGVLPVCPGECAVVNGMQFCNPNVYEIPKNNCDTVIRFVVEVLDFDINITGIEEINCDKPQIHLEAEASFVDANFDFIWKDSNGAIVGTGPTALILQGGDYTIEGIAEKNGVTCVEIVDFSVDEDSDIPDFSIDSEDLNCNNQQVQINFSTTSSIVGFSWTGPSSFSSNIAEPLIDEAGEYKLTVASENGCTISKVIIIDEDFASPVVDYEDPELNCLSPNMILNIGSDIPIAEYRWQSPDGSSDSGMNPYIDQEGQYLFTAIGENGCVTDFVVDVAGDFDLPTATINSDVITCYNPEINLNFQTSYNIINQSWQDPDGNNINSEDIDILVGGNYILELEADNGCLNQIPVFIEEDNLPPVLSTDEDQLWNCNTTEINIGAVIETGNFEITWSTLDGHIQSGNGTQNLTVDEPGSYSIEVFNPGNGCSTSATIDVAINENYPRDLIISSLDPVCFGDYSGLIQIDEIIGGEPPFTLYVNGTTMEDGMVMNDYNAGLYLIELRDANDCLYKTEVELFDPLQILLDMDEYVTVNYGDETDIALSYNIPEEEVLEIQWLDKDQNIISTGSKLQYQPIQSERVTAMLRSIDGCEIYRDVNVNLRKSIDVFAPTAFTPNNDGVNDKFTLFGRSDIATIKEMHVFDRWGNTVYSEKELQLNDESNGWDGNFGSKELLSGVYVYSAVVELLDGTEFIFKGSITLLR